MSRFNKMVRKLGLRRPKYYTIQVRTPDYISFKTLAAQEKRNYVDFFHELLDVYIDCKQKKHESTIKELLRKQDALVDNLKLYHKRVGKIYVSPATNTSKSPSNGDLS